MQDLNVIGSEEWCSFESLNIPAIKARIDSGAKTSSIQAANIKKYKKEKEDWVSFEINPIQDNLSIVVQCKSPIISTRTVKSSTGVAEKRFVIKAPIKFGNSIHEIQLTLANRDGMDFRMLLGRTPRRPNHCPSCTIERPNLLPPLSFRSHSFAVTTVGSNVPASSLSH